MENKPYINAGNLTPEEFSEWIGKIGELSRWRKDPLLLQLQNAVFCLRSAIGLMEARISFLDSSQIIRPTEHASLNQEEIHLMKNGVAYFENHCQTIVSFLSRFKNIHYPEANKEGQE